jgi:hypothetical protein
MIQCSLFFNFPCGPVDGRDCCTQAVQPPFKTLFKVEGYGQKGIHRRPRGLSDCQTVGLSACLVV